MNIQSALAAAIIEGIEEKKGRKITIVDLRNIETAPCQYFVICEGGSPQQVQAIARSVEDVARTKLGERPSAVIGTQHALWVAMDYGNVMVHIFMPEEREFYDLENLWEDANITNIEDKN